MSSPSAHGLDMLLTPAKQSLAHGKTAEITILDKGTLPLRVTVRTVVLHGGCAQTGTRNIHVVPASFTLKAGHSQVVHATVSGPPADYGIAFSGSVLSAGRSIAVTDAVGSQIVTGKATACTAKPVAIAPHGGGIPTAYYVGGGILGLFLLVYGVAAILHLIYKPRPPSAIP